MIIILADYSMSMVSKEVCILMMKRSYILYWIVTMVIIVLSQILAL